METVGALAAYAVGILIAAWIHNNEKAEEIFCAILIFAFLGGFMILSIYAGVVCLLGGKIASGLVCISIGIAVLRFLIT